MNRYKTAILAAAVLIGLGRPAAGQDPRGTIIGRVVDASEAVIPGVEVRATNVATGVNAAGVANESGSYNIPFLLPGTYTIQAEMPGFKKYLREGIQVRVSETVELIIRMELGQINETVVATAETPILDTAGSSLGQVIDERRVLELPLFAGNPAELTLLTPGVVNTTDMRLRKAAFNNAPSQIATDGNGQYNNEFQIDGVSNTFAVGNGTARIAFSPPATAIKEFKMQTSPNDASIGHTIGAITNVSTAGGTNDLHGEAHYWARNSAFDAPNFFNNKNRTAVPVYQDHRYGASAGGPVMLPKVYKGRNRTFWYYAWEANKWGVPGASTSTVPTAAQRRGDFSELLKVGSQYQIYDPTTTAPAPDGRFIRRAFDNNIIPESRLDPVGQRLIGYYPLPNQPGTTRDGLNNFFYSPKALEDYYVHLVRIDHAFSEKHRLFLRMDYDFWEEDKNDIFGNRVNSIILNRINRGLALDDVYVLNSKMVLNVRYGLTSQDFPERRVSQGFDLSSLGFAPSLVSLVNKDLATVPRVAAGGYTRFSNWESGDGTNTALTHHVTGNVTRLEGNHNLRFGVDARAYRAFGNRYPQSVSPDLDFANTYTHGPFDNSAAAPIGQELAALLLGVPAGSMARSASFALQDTFFALYLHDDFKVNSKLTLNIGVRYELETPMTERFNRLVGGFAFDQPNPIERQARDNYARNPIPELSPSGFRVMGGLTFVNSQGLGRSPFRGEKNNFEPRFGFAYQLARNTVLRAGYGLFHDTIGVNSTTAVQTGFSQSTPIQASLDSGLTFQATTANPFPNGLLDPLGPAGGLRTNLGQPLGFYDTNLKQPYASRWSLGVQQMLVWQFLAEATYVGNRGTRLGAVRQLNATPARYLSTQPSRDGATIGFLTRQFPSPFAGIDPIYGAFISRENLLRPYPQFGNISVEEPTGYSWYHALQTRVERRFSRGFSFQLAYTWAKLMEAVEFLNPSDTMPYESIGSLDRTHRLAMSGIWELPVGRGRRFGGSLPVLLNHAIGGWQLNGVVTRQSGPALGFGNAIFTGDFKNIVLPKDQRTAERWFNIDAGFNRVSGQQLDRNIRTMPLRFSGIRGDGQARWDYSIIKNFPAGETVKIQFRAEVFNAWNHANFNAPNTTPANSAFGQITSTSSDARTWQFALKLTF